MKTAKYENRKVWKSQSEILQSEITAKYKNHEEYENRKVWKPQSEIPQNEIPTLKYKNHKIWYRKVWKPRSMEIAKWNTTKWNYRKV